MATEVEIGITTIENNIEITSQSTDQVVDIGVTDNRDEVTINVTPTVIEININKNIPAENNLVTSVNTRVGDVVIVASDVGLGNVDNTGDFDKPISNDAQVAFNSKADLINGVVPLYQLPNFAEDFIDDSQFKVLKTATKTLQESFDKTDEALFKARGTELSEGGIPSINTDPTKFNITPAVLGQIKDGINYYAISYAGATAIPIDNIAAINTYVYLDNAGVLRQQTTAPTRTDFYTKLFLARFASNGTQLIGLDRLRNPSGQYSNSVRELYDYLISNNVPLRQGLAITGNANLTFNRAAGSVFRFGAGSDATPNTPSFTAINTASFFLGTRSSLAGALITNVPVTQYDNNGLLTTISNNKFVAHRLYFFTTPSLAIQYAQTEYSTLEAAKIGALTETYVTNPAVANGALLGWWIVGKNATDLTNPNTSYFLPFTIGGGGTGVGSGALLASNNLIDVANPITSLLNIGGEPLTNKQNSLATDGTGAKYPTVDTVNSALALKSNDSQVVKLTGAQVVAGTKSFVDVVNMTKDATSISPTLADFSFLANRTILTSRILNAYGFYDANVFSKNYGNASYSSFSANTELGGVNSINHYNAFQSRGNWSGTGTIFDYRGFVDDNFISSGSGVITNKISFHSSGGTNSGTVTNWYGLKIDNAPAGGTVTNFYPIYVEGGNCFLGDSASLLQDFWSKNGGFFRSSLQASNDEFETSLGTNGATGVGILTLGNRGTNEIRLGRDVAGGNLDVYINNTVGPLSTSNGTKAFSITSAGVIKGNQFEPQSGSLILGFTASLVFLGSGGNVAISGTGKLSSAVAPTSSNDVVRKLELDTKANSASPALTGIPTAPTATTGTNTTQIATTAFVQSTTNLNALLLTGNQSFAGIKSSTITGTNGNSIALVNESTATGSASMSINVSSIGSQNGQRGINISNNNAGGNAAGSQALYIDNNSTGTGIQIKNFSSGTGLILQNISGAGDLLNAGSGTTKILSSGALISNDITANGQLKLKAYTVATLPTGFQGATAYVTDATSPIYRGALTGGGTIKCPVFFNGTSWESH